MNRDEARLNLEGEKLKSTASELKSFLGSAIYIDFKETLEAFIMQVRDDLEKPGTSEETAMLRGAVAELRRVSNIFEALTVAAQLQEEEKETNDVRD